MTVEILVPANRHTDEERSLSHNLICRLASISISTFSQKRKHKKRVGAWEVIIFILSLVYSTVLSILFDSYENYCTNQVQFWLGERIPDIYNQVTKKSVRE